MSCILLMIFNVLQVTKQSNGKLTVVGKNKDDEEKTVEDVDFVLMATGRKPRTQGLGLEEVGWPTQRTYVHKHKGSGPHRHSHVALAGRSRSKGPPSSIPCGTRRPPCLPYGQAQEAARQRC